NPRATTALYDDATAVATPVKGRGCEISRPRPASRQYDERERQPPKRLSTNSTAAMISAHLAAATNRPIPPKTRARISNNTTSAMCPPCPAGPWADNLYVSNGGPLKRPSTAARASPFTLDAVRS